MATGYSRQSAGDIVDGLVMTASIFNNEFDAILSTFHATTGHDHDGTAGGGAPITKLKGNEIEVGLGDHTLSKLKFLNSSNDTALITYDTSFSSIVDETSGIFFYNSAFSIGTNLNMAGNRFFLDANNSGLAYLHSDIPGTVYIYGDNRVDIKTPNSINLLGNGAVIDVTSATDLTIRNTTNVLADDDLVGRIVFEGANDNDTNGTSVIDDPTDYVHLDVLAADVSDGTERGKFAIKLRRDAVMAESFVVSENGTFTRDLLQVTGRTEENSSANPEIILKNIESSATEQQIGAIKFDGEDANGNTDTYALIGADTADTTDGSEDGRLYVRTIMDGNLYKRFAIGSKGIEVYGGQASDPNSNPELVLKNTETAVVGSDQSLGIIKFQGKDTNNNTTDYGLITGYASVPTDGSEDGKVTIRVMDEGNYVTPFTAHKNGANVRGRLSLHSDSLDHLDPDLSFINNETGPHDNNVLGQMWFYGNNSVMDNRHFADIQAISSDVTDGEEDGKLYFSVDSDGTRRTRLTVDKHGIAVDNRIFIAGSGGNSDVDNNWHDPDLVFANYQDAVNGNILGQCLYYGNNDAATPERELYAYTEARSSNVVDGSEYGAYKVYLMNDGAPEETLNLHTNGSTLRSHALTLKGKSNAATTNANPTLVLSNDEPADTVNNQTLGVIAFDGNNSAGNGRYYGYISGTALDSTENVETGRMNFHIRNGQGTTESILQLNHTGASLSGGELFIHGPHDTTAGSNPIVVFRNNETASNGQLLGCLAFQGENSVGGQMNYGFISSIAEDVTTGQEESRLTIDVLDGSNTGRVEKLRVDKDGIEVSGDISLGDSNKIALGASNDLQITHNGSHSYILDRGDGNLILQSTGAGVHIIDENTSKPMGKFSTGGSSSLWWAGASGDGRKIETTETGVTVTGDIDLSTASTGVILTSPNGTRYKLTVDNSGNLTTTAV